MKDSRVRLRERYSWTVFPRASGSEQRTETGQEGFSLLSSSAEPALSRAGPLDCISTYGAEIEAVRRGLVESKEDADAFPARLLKNSMSSIEDIRRWKTSFPAVRRPLDMFKPFAHASDLPAHSAASPPQLLRRPEPLCAL